jgi:hypothetical protein
MTKAKMKLPFDQDIAVGKIMKWIVKTDQSFSTVDNEHFLDYATYLKSDITIPSRRTQSCAVSRKCTLKRNRN